MVRKSKKRDAIYAELCSVTTHPSAEMLYARLKPKIPDLSLGTVYTNLAAFKKEGLALSVGTVNGKERFDGDVSAHVHFICKCCGEVTDLPEAELPAMPDFDGEIEGCQLNYYGKCPSCKHNTMEALQ